MFKVRIPGELPSIMAGINPTIMMALSMVIIASMVGAGGLGNDVLTSISRLDIGLGFESGLAVVLLAAIMDRITGRMATTRPSKRVQASPFDRYGRSTNCLPTDSRSPRT
ncbi:hypothetical protein [Aromatoleum petrolei]|uniref:hypothetical protein n=1 Tax=Aromatoleum petrolei TaxID=76116 RepID=UPI001FCF9FBE|nr:hypothetical protein [Aromatoleum petrolei]